MIYKYGMLKTHTHLEYYRIVLCRYIQTHIGVNLIKNPHRQFKI